MDTKKNHSVNDQADPSAKPITPMRLSSSHRLDLDHALIDLTHGAGGRRTADLIASVFTSQFRHPALARADDQAIVPFGPGELALTTDSYVVTPLFFPGGDIGKLSVCGTINDIAVGGAEPLYISVAFILEEGLPVRDLVRVVASMREVEASTGVHIVTGDTKVVERGKADKMFVTTAGVGRVRDASRVRGAMHVKPGDAVVVSGHIGDHGVAVMSCRQHLGFETNVQSDCAPLHDLVRVMLEAVPEIHCMRDPTRGGVATLANEIAEASRVGIVLEEERCPVRSEVAAACEILGLDPLYVANEGLVVAFVEAHRASMLVDTMRTHPFGKNAEIIGTVVESHRPMVQLVSPYGGRRVLPWLSGEQLPRIC